MDGTVKDIIARFSNDRCNIFPILQQVQEIEKYLSPGAIAEVSCFLNISDNDVYSVASSYSQFSFASDCSQSEDNGDNI